MRKFFIPGEVPSSKNGRRIFNNRLIDNENVTQYIKETKKEWIKYKGLIDLDEPVVIGLKFIRGSKRKFDYHNACQIVFDLMSTADGNKNKKGLGLIKDDNADCLIPVFIPYEYDKQNPGVWVYLINTNEYVSAVDRLID